MKKNDEALAIRMRLIGLIRRIVREEMEKALQDHLDGYEHTEKPTDETDLN